VQEASSDSVWFDERQPVLRYRGEGLAHSFEANRETVPGHASSVS
jgi:hypothetical protein